MWAKSERNKQTECTRLINTALWQKFTTQRFSIQIRTTETKPNPNPNPNTNPNPNPNPNPTNPNPTDPTKPYHLTVCMVLGGELLPECPLIQYQ